MPGDASPEHGGRETRHAPSWPGHSLMPEGPSADHDQRVNDFSQETAEPLDPERQVSLSEDEPRLSVEEAPPDTELSAAPERHSMSPSLASLEELVVNAGLAAQAAADELRSYQTSEMASDGNDRTRPVELLSRVDADIKWDRVQQSDARTLSCFHFPNRALVTVKPSFVFAYVA